jgi:hypothetical protein
VRQLAPPHGAGHRGQATFADLWKARPASGTRFAYEEVDKALYLLVDQRYEVSELVAEQLFDEKFVRAVARRIQGSQYKRRLPVIGKISSRTIDRDFRYARDCSRCEKVHLCVSLQHSLRASGVRLTWPRAFRLHLDLYSLLRGGFSRLC